MILKEMRKVFTVIVYLLFLFLIYVIDCFSSDSHVVFHVFPADLYLFIPTAVWLPLG